MIKFFRKIHYYLLRRIALVTLFFLLIISCSSSHIKYVEYREIKSYDTYNTPPKKVISTTYNVDYIDGVMNEKRTFQSIIYFDAKGNKTRLVSIKPDRTKRGEYQYKYDKYGNQISYQSMSSDSIIGLSIKYHYNEHNQIVKKEWIGKKDTTVTNYVYDKKLRTVDIIRKDRQGEITEITKETYDKNLYRIGQKVFNPKGEMTSEYYYGYDSNNNMNYKKIYSARKKSSDITEYIYNKQNDLVMVRFTKIKDGNTLVGETIGRRVYKYDERNNRIEKKSINKGKVIGIVRNQYTYY